MKAEEEERQQPVSAGGMAWVLVIVIAFAGALWIAEKKTDKMVSSFASSSVRDKVALNYPRELEREIGKLKSELKILKASELPVYRETKAEEKERWEKNKHHLHKHIRALNVLLKERTEELELVRSQVPPETYAESDSDLLAELSQGELLQ